MKTHWFRNVDIAYPHMDYIGINGMWLCCLISYNYNFSLFFFSLCQDTKALMVWVSKFNSLVLAQGIADPVLNYYVIWWWIFLVTSFYLGETKYFWIGNCPTHFLHPTETVIVEQFSWDKADESNSSIKLCFLTTSHLEMYLHVICSDFCAVRNY